MASEIKLKPCPFCSGEARVAESHDTKRKYSLYWVICTDCHISTMVDNRRGRVIAAWNRRAGEKT